MQDVAKNMEVCEQSKERVGNKQSTGLKQMISSSKATTEDFQVEPHSLSMERHMKVYRSMPLELGFDSGRPCENPVANEAKG